MLWGSGVPSASNLSVTATVSAGHGNSDKIIYRSAAGLCLVSRVEENPPINEPRDPIGSNLSAPQYQHTYPLKSLALATRNVIIAEHLILIL